MFQCIRKVRTMRVPQSTKMVMRSTPAPQREQSQPTLTFAAQSKSAFNQTCSYPQQNSQNDQQNFIGRPSVSEKFNNIHQPSTLKSDNSDLQQENAKVKSYTTAPLALNIPVTENE